MSAQMMTERFEMRLPTKFLEQVDAWRGNQSDLPSRAESIRRLIELGLASSTHKKEVKFSDGEKLILLALRDISKNSTPKDAEIDLDFVANTIFGGHSNWAIEMEYSGIFHRHEDSKAIVSEVVDVLDMWSFLESGYQDLSPSDRASVAADAAPFGNEVLFPGFDGNEEGEYRSVARCFTEQLNRFSLFKGRELNAHVPTIDSYRRMMAVFMPIRPTLIGRNLSASEIVNIINARRYPGYNKVTKVATAKSDMI